MLRHASAALAAVVTVLGCTSPAQPDAQSDDALTAFTRSLRPTAVVFVLNQVEQQATESITLFDHACSGVRIVHTIRDTISLTADGGARRAFRLDRKQNGRLLESSYLSFTGRWSQYDGSSTRGGPNIVLSMRPDNGGAPFEMYLRLRDANTLTTESALGGSCPGSPNDGRNAQFAYGRQ